MDDVISARQYDLLYAAIRHTACLVPLTADQRTLAACQRRGLVALCALPPQEREPGGYPVLFAGLSALCGYNIVVYHDDGEDTAWWYQMWGVYNVFPSWVFPAGEQRRGGGVWSLIAGMQDLSTQLDQAPPAHAPALPE